MTSSGGPLRESVMRLLVFADDVVLRLSELDAGRVEDGHGNAGHVVALHVLGDRFPGPLVGERDPEHGVDEGALPDPGLPADEDVRVPELGHFALLRFAEVGGGVSRDILDGRLALSISNWR